MFFPRYKWMSAVFIPTTILEGIISHAQRLSTYNFIKTENWVFATAVFDIKGYKAACGASFDEFEGRGKTRIEAIRDCLRDVRWEAGYRAYHLKKKRESSVSERCV